MVTVNVPKDSAFPSVSIGFAGLYGTIAGMSSQGLTGAQALHCMETTYIHNHNPLLL